MRITALAVVATLLAPLAAHADTMHRSVEVMRAADDNVCNLLFAQSGDRCTRLVSDKRATVYRSGNPRGITRIVIALPIAGQTLVGPSIDLVGAATITPTISDVAIDGKPGVAVELATTVDAITTRTVIACAASGKTAYKCTTLDAGRCDIAVGGDGKVASSACGDARLTLL